MRILLVIGLGMIALAAIAAGSDLIIAGTAALLWMIGVAWLGQHLPSPKPTGGARRLEIVAQLSEEELVALGEEVRRED